MDYLVFNVAFPRYNREIPIFTARPPWSDFIDGLPYLYMRWEGATYFVVYFHGNVTTIFDNVEFMRRMSRELRCDIFALEYPGYYLRDPREMKSVREMIEAMVSPLRRAVEGKKVIFMGQSIGSLVAAQLTRHIPVERLIMITPLAGVHGTLFDGLTSIAAEFANVMMSRDTFYHTNNVALVRKAKFPVLVIYGGADGLLPVYHGMALSRSGAMICRFEGGHKKFEAEFDSVRSAILRFINQKNL